MSFLTVLLKLGLSQYADKLAYVKTVRDLCFLVQSRYKTAWGNALGEWHPAIKKLGLFIEALNRARVVSARAHSAKTSHNRDERTAALADAQEAQAEKSNKKAKLAKVRFIPTSPSACFISIPGSQQDITQSIDA